MTLSSLSLHQSMSEDKRIRAQEVVERYGRSSLARFTLFPDKSHFFSPNGSVIAFVRKGATVLSLGDPIGPKEDAACSISAFQDFCARNQWQTCFYQVQPDYLQIYADLGFKVMNIGQEAVVDLAAFTRHGKTGAKFRNAIHRMTRQGHYARIYEPPLNDNLLDELKAVSDEWLTGRLGSEVRFSVGWFDEEYVRHTAVAAIYTPEGCMTAFANIVTEYKRNGVALDLMRHRRKVESRTMDYLFVSFLEWAKMRGYPTFSLGFSPLSGVGEAPNDSFIEKALRLFYEEIKEYPNFKGLYTFKDKFHPRWESRFMAYPGFTHLPAIGMALARALSGDNFLWDYMKK